MSFPTYPRYKDANVGWLGKLPDHWLVAPLRTLAMEGRNAFIDGDWIESPFITGEGIRLIQTGNIGTGHYKEQGFRYVSADTFEKLGCTEVTPNDILICRLADPVGRACLAPTLGARMITSVDVCILKPRRTIDPRFVVYTLSSLPYLAFMEGQCRGGTRDRVSRTFLGNVRMPVPHLDEQKAIADFLDRETAKIDDLISAQNHLTELLEEKHQAIVAQAITRGLRADAPMRDSGNPWLGNVPEHWSVAPLSNRYSIQLGKMLDTTKIVGRHLRPYLRVVDVQWGDINTDNLPHMDFDEDARSRFRLLPKDLLVNEGGSYPGRSAIWSGEINECYYQKALHRLRPRRDDQDTTKFLYHVMWWAAHLGMFVAGGNETTIEHLPAEKLARYRFAFPPLSEQIEIADFLETELCRHDALTLEASQSIKLLGERRSALITASVTGQIDIRGHVEEQAA